VTNFGINKRRLLVTDSEIQRDEVIAQHVNSTKPTVLTSPSLHTGLDLKDDLSRFQIITKVPYPDIGDRWINEKRKISGKWYTWQTALMVRFWMFSHCAAMLNTLQFFDLYRKGSSIVIAISVEKVAVLVSNDTWLLFQIYRNPMINICPHLN
jgi:hypothetical protein